LCLPAANGNETVPENNSNRSGSTTPASALLSFSQALRSGKNACVMQNVRPS
jgi:hypothetical protein